MNSFQRKLRGSKTARKLLASWYFWLTAVGFSPLKLFQTMRELPLIYRDYSELKKQNQILGSKYKLRFSIPCIGERGSASGTAQGHYFHQDLLVARKIFVRKPEKHVDVGSRVDGFIAHVAAFRPIEVFDIRSQDTSISNIVFKKCDLMNAENVMQDYCDSLSCLHALEHFGLGRYGDPIDIEGHLRGFRNLQKLLKRKGILYLSVPIGPERIDFNGHRVFAVKTILEMGRNNFEVIGFSYVDDQGYLHESLELDSDQVADNFGCYYGCGIFEFLKI